MKFEVRSLHEQDRAAWGVLWEGYLRFYETELHPRVTQTTWRRLMDPEGPIHGFCADAGGGKLLGIVHYLFHPVTWSPWPRCYLEDLFTAEEARGHGVGRELIEAVYSEADSRGADQVYWLTAETNTTARKLYDSVAKVTPFIKYRR